MWCYSNTCINNGLIRLNKFISRFTDEFYNLLFISIRIFHTTFLYNIRHDNLSFMPCNYWQDLICLGRRLHQKQTSSFYFLFIRTAPLTYIRWPRAQGRPRPGFCPLLEKLCACGALTVTERVSIWNGFNHCSLWFVFNALPHTLTLTLVLLLETPYCLLTIDRGKAST